MKSVAEKLCELEKLVGTTDLTAWENDFVKHVSRIVKARNGDTRTLTGNQVEKVEDIYDQHHSKEGP